MSAADKNDLYNSVLQNVMRCGVWISLSVDKSLEQSEHATPAVASAGVARGSFSCLWGNACAHKKENAPADRKCWAAFSFCGPCPKMSAAETAL